MNKEELLKLKERLITETQKKKYGFFDPTNDFVYPENAQPVEEIISEIDTQTAIKKLEDKIERFMTLAISKGINPQALSIFIPNYFFASEFFLNKCENDENFNSDRPITKEDILYDIVPIYTDFHIFDISGPCFIDEEEFEKYLPLGTVKYSEFVKKLELLGYEISSKNFEELFENIHNAKPSIIRIDFSPKKQNAK